MLTGTADVDTLARQDITVPTPIQAASWPYALAGRAQGDAALPVEPVGRALESGAEMAFGAIEALEQDQEAMFSRVEMGGQLGEGVFERVQPEPARDALLHHIDQHLRGGSRIFLDKHEEVAAAV